MKKKPTCLLILDGYGLSDKKEGNAVYLANSPNIDMLMEKYPFARGNATGLAVGLPEGQMGNSEVGHLNIGAGRVVYQSLTRISKEINEGDFFKNEVLLNAIKNCKDNDSALHFIGLLSDGGVHSHNTHLYALLELAKQNDISKVFVHCFLDGRDTPPSSALGYAKELQAKMDEIGVGRIATVEGRYYVMDRDNNYDRVKLAYDAMVNGVGNKAASGVEAIASSYDANVTDEFLIPTVVVENDTPIGTIKNKDSVVFFNYRPDRAREITHAFCDNDFTGFDRPERLELNFVCFTNYDPLIPNKTVAFEKIEIKNTFGEWIAANNMTQARMAETEKYAHVTFFFNGGVEKPNEGEDRFLANSPKVATYDLKPEMSVYEVCDNMVGAIESGKYDVIITNFANPDMVGHTGVVEAVVKAIEACDECVGRVYDALLKAEGTMFVCADHGNAEQLIDEVNGGPFTAHTTNDVPFILVNYDEAYTLKEGGKLADIVPTMIDVMGMQKPVEMTGESLLIKK